jgi:hypothetical protein
MALPCPYGRRLEDARMLICRAPSYTTHIFEKALDRNEHKYSGIVLSNTILTTKKTLEKSISRICGKKTLVLKNLPQTHGYGFGKHHASHHQQTLARACRFERIPRRTHAFSNIIVQKQRPFLRRHRMSSITSTLKCTGIIIQLDLHPTCVRALGASRCWAVEQCDVAGATYSSIPGRLKSAPGRPVRSIA